MHYSGSTSPCALFSDSHPGFRVPPWYSRLQRPLISGLVAGLSVGLRASSDFAACRIAACCVCVAFLPRCELAVALWNAA